jgi:hypothetical protein
MFLALCFRINTCCGLPFVPPSFARAARRSRYVVLDESFDAIHAFSKSTVAIAVTPTTFQENFFPRGALCAVRSMTACSGGSFGSSPRSWTVRHHSSKIKLYQADPRFSNLPTCLADVALPPFTSAAARMSAYKSRDLYVKCRAESAASSV